MKFAFNFIMTSDPQLMVNVIEPLVADHTLTNIEIVSPCEVLATANWKWPNITITEYSGKVVIDSWTEELELASRTYWRDGEEVSHDEIELGKYLEENKTIPDILDSVVGKIWR